MVLWCSNWEHQSNRRDIMSCLIWPEYVNSTKFFTQLHQQDLRISVLRHVHHCLLSQWRLSTVPVPAGEVNSCSTTLVVELSPWGNGGSISCSSPIVLILKIMQNGPKPLIAYNSGKGQSTMLKINPKFPVETRTINWTNLSTGESDSLSGRRLPDA